MTMQPAERMEQLFGAAGIPWGLTPEQQFTQYARQEFRPGRDPLRSAFYDVQQPLMQQWFLGQPSLEGYGGFSAFMDQPAGYDPYGGAGLRTRAQQAADIAGMPTGQFFQYYDPQADYEGPAITADLQNRLAAMTPAQQLMYRQTYGTGQEAAMNQLQLTNLMALQRPGGGIYGGAMGGAITSALGELQSELAFRDPSANFLDWYLARTAEGQGVGGFLTA
jgi:hypothetical protein